MLFKTKRNQIQFDKKLRKNYFKQERVFYTKNSAINSIFDAGEADESVALSSTKLRD